MTYRILEIASNIYERIKVDDKGYTTLALYKPIGRYCYDISIVDVHAACDYLVNKGILCKRIVPYRANVGDITYHLTRAYK